MKKQWIGIIGIVLFVLLVLWVIFATNEINSDINKSSANKSNNTSENAEAVNLHIVETESGKKIWELTADKAVYSDKNAKLTNVKGRFYGEDDEVILTFEAPQGNYIQNAHKLSLNNGALLIEPNQNISVESDTMYWSNENDAITAEGNVKVTKENFITSYADKTIFSSDFSKIELEGNTYSELNISG